MDHAQFTFFRISTHKTNSDVVSKNCTIESAASGRKTRAKIRANHTTPHSAQSTDKKKKSTFRFVTHRQDLQIVPKRLSTFGNAQLTKHPKLIKRRREKDGPATKPPNKLDLHHRVFFASFFESETNRVKYITIVSDRTLNKHEYGLSLPIQQQSTQYTLFYWFFFSVLCGCWKKETHTQNKKLWCDGACTIWIVMVQTIDLRWESNLAKFVPQTNSHTLCARVSNRWLFIAWWLWINFTWWPNVHLDCLLFRHHFGRC